MEKTWLQQAEEKKKVKMYNLFLQSFAGVHVHCPSKFIHIVPGKVDFIRSGVWKRYDRMIRRLKFQTLIRNYTITAMAVFILLSLCLLVNIWIRQAYGNDGILLQLCLGYLTGKLAFLLTVVLGDIFPRNYYDIKLKRKGYSEYF